MPAKRQPPQRTSNRVERYPKMVAAALHAIRQRDGDAAFDKIARLTLGAVAGAICAKDGPKALKDLVRYWA